MILIEFLESTVLITRHFNVNPCKITLVRVKTLMILLNLCIEFMSLHLDSWKINLLLLLLWWLLLVRSHLRWIVHWSPSHWLLTLHRLSTLWVGHTTWLAIWLLSLQTTLLHGIPLLPWWHSSHYAWAHHSTRSLWSVYTWHSYTWLPLWHLHGKICW